MICVKWIECLAGLRPAPWLLSANNHLYWFRTICHSGTGAQEQRRDRDSRGINKLQRITTGNCEKAPFIYKSVICHKGDFLFLSRTVWFPPCLGLCVFSFLLFSPIARCFTLQDGGKNKQMEEGGIKREREEGCGSSNWARGRGQKKGEGMRGGRAGGRMERWRGERAGKPDELI